MSSGLIISFVCVDILLGRAPFLLFIFYSSGSETGNVDCMTGTTGTKLAALIQRGDRWSGAKTPTGENRSQVEASPRLSEWRERMVHRGVRAGPVQMVFCTMGDEQCVDFA